MSPGSVGLEVVTNSIAHEPVLQMSGGPDNEAFSSHLLRNLQQLLKTNHL